MRKRKILETRKVQNPGLVYNRKIASAFPKDISLKSIIQYQILFTLKNTNKIKANLYKNMVKKET